jgi:hypothetical protein
VGVEIGVTVGVAAGVGVEIGVAVGVAVGVGVGPARAAPVPIMAKLNGNITMQSSVFNPVL